jgi:hypothetical protein
MLWLFAPRGAYHPAQESPFVRESADLGCQSQQPGSSCFCLVFSTLLELSFMQALFRALLVEARRTGRPIVYLFHSYEFAHLIHPLVSSRCISVPISAVGCADMK